MAHPLAAHAEMGHLNAAAVTDHALVADRLELAAVAFPLLGGTEDPLAEQTVLLRPKRSVVDGLRFLDLAVGPGTYLVRRGQFDHDTIEILHLSHIRVPP